MKPHRPRIRTISILALTLGLTLAGAACDKSGEGSKDPDGDQTATKDGDEQAGGAEYMYAADGFTLTATMKVQFELSSSEGTGAAEMSARSLIEATPADEGQLRVHGKVLELTSYEGSGQLDPEFMKKQAEESGQEAVDIRTELAESESWMIIDRKGQLDKDATKALAENQAEDGDASDFGLFNLPDLPPVDLIEGEKVTLPTKQVERQFPFGTVPVEIDETWTLRGVDDEGIAELDVSTEGSGATELAGQGGTAMVSMLEESSFTVFFDTNTKLPVSFNGYSASETSIDAQGQSFSFATNNEISGTYEVGAAEPAAAPAEPAAAPAEPAAAPAEDAAAPAEDAAASE